MNNAVGGCIILAGLTLLVPGYMGTSAGLCYLIFYLLGQGMYYSFVVRDAAVMIMRQIIAELMMLSEKCDLATLW